MLIISLRSAIWQILTHVTTIIILRGLLSPEWLMGQTISKVIGGKTITYTQLVGINVRCILIDNKTHHGHFDFDRLATDGDEFPIVWKATLFFMLLGLGIMILTIFTGLMSCCSQFHSVCKKSIFSLIGTVQILAGVFLLISMMLYPFGWESEFVHHLCGPGAGAFFPSKCSLQWGYYYGIIGTLMTFVCGAFSVIVEKSMSMERIEPFVLDGRNLICLA